MRVHATYADRSDPRFIATRDIFTHLKPFGLGMAVYNFARKHSAGEFTALVRDGKGFVRAMSVRQVGDHYEGRI